MNNKQEIMLHCCCAPCASSVIERLLPEYNISVLFFNPNIEPHEEYEKRKNELIRLLHEMSLIFEVKWIECKYNDTIFKHMALSARKEPEGGLRCRKCVKLRLDETATYAFKNKISLFATTLSVSPHKNAQLINKIGNKVAKFYEMTFLEADFKKQNGFARTLELSKKHNIYRQNYCGCKIDAN